MNSHIYSHKYMYIKKNTFNLLSLIFKNVNCLC